MMLELKNIYRGKEVKFYDLFKEVTPKLLSEFLTQYPDFHNKNTDVKNGKMLYSNPSGPTENLISNVQGWNVTPIKPMSNTAAALQAVEEAKIFFPTAYNLVKQFGDGCFMATYSVFEPNTVLYRHTGIENRDAKYIRIHIPLYIPKGDIGFEVQGEEIYWDDIFSFNNQKLHSVWNNTNERRLIFLIDLSREICDLPPAPPWTEKDNVGVPVFEKTAVRF